MLCPGVQPTNQSIFLRGKLVKGSGEQLVHPPKSDCTDSIVPLQGSFWPTLAGPLWVCVLQTPKFDGVQG